MWKLPKFRIYKLPKSHRLKTSAFYNLLNDMFSSKSSWNLHLLKGSMFEMQLLDKFKMINFGKQVSGRESIFRILFLLKLSSVKDGKLVCFKQERSMISLFSKLRTWRFGALNYENLYDWRKFFPDKSIDSNLSEFYSSDFRSSEDLICPVLKEMY